MAQYTQAINSSRRIFRDYESYADRRIDNYTQWLDNVIDNRAADPKTYNDCGFTPGDEDMQRDNMVRTLRLQLLSSNYDELKTQALNWIDDSSRGASTWNVFLLGNTSEIKSAIHGWNQQLADNASERLTNENPADDHKALFRQFNDSLSDVDSGLDNIRRMFTDSDWPPLYSLLIALLLYGALMLPYWLQDRHTKSLYRLRGMKGSSKPGTFVMDQEDTDTPQPIQPEPETTIGIPESDTDSPTEEKNDFDSFTI